MTFQRKLTGTSTYDSYQFVIGNPIYRTDKVVVAGERMSLSSSQTTDTDTVSFNAEDHEAEPQVYQILISGVSSSAASSIELAYTESNETITKISLSGWTMDVPLSYDYFLNGAYSFTYSYKSSAKTFTPSYSFYYIYSILPTIRVSILNKRTEKIF